MKELPLFKRDANLFKGLNKSKLELGKLFCDFIEMLFNIGQSSRPVGPCG